MHLDTRMIRSLRQVLFCVAFSWSLARVNGAPITPQLNLPQVTSVRSQSGQFIVNAPQARRDLTAQETNTTPDLISLTPPLVSVSCERIKQILWR